MKKLIVFLFSLILSVVFSTSALAYDVEIDGIYYNLNSEDKTAEVTSKWDDKYSGEVIIPSSITVEGKEYTVTSIGKSAFDDCSGLTSVTIPNSVTSIGDKAFNYCIGLTSVTIPNSVTSIGSYAFRGCSGLISVTIPNSVTSIGNYAFLNCTGLTSVTIPNSVTSIGNSAFWGCSGLTSVTIPNSVTSIGGSVFSLCSKLEDIIIVNNMFVHLPETYSGHYSIPENISQIIGGAFYNCRGLTSITIPNSVTSIGNSAFKGCSSLTSVTIPNSVTSIVTSAFSQCTGLTSVTIPNSVTSIGGWAFEFCTGLTSLTIPNSVTSIGSSAFDNCRIEELYYDCSINPMIGTDYLKKLTIGDNISVVYDYFSSSPLRKITLGKNVTQIRAEAFKSSQIEDFTVTGKEPPYLYPNVFGTQDLSKATLNVPESKIEYYQTTEPWSLFGKVLTLSGETPKDPEKCSTPSILFSEGKLQFTCNTEGAKFYYTLNSTDVKRSETLVEANTVALSACYEISCTAKAEGFANSDVATAKLYWLPTADIGTNINTAKTRGVVIQSAGGFITLSGLNTNERVDFFAIDGAALGSATATDGTATFSAKSGTIVVAKIGKESVKIAVE
ncbi:MAG: leucine-rich repeat domain-containing protein [Prevotella sp.]|nr:leucine-rich repeat domain-containing protein [Prevotella sp.]